MEDHEGQARRIVTKYMWISMGVGLLPIPFLDVVGITALQLRMLQLLSRLYDVPFSRDLGKKIISALLGSIVPTSLSVTLGSAVKLVPVVGSVVGGLSLPVFAGAATYAVGKVFIQHFEAGGTLLDFEPAKVREYFRQEFQKGQDLVSESRQESGYVNRTSTAET